MATDPPKPIRRPNSASFHITARSEVDAEALPPDGSTPGMDRTMEWLTAGAGLEPGYRMPRVIED